MELPADVRALFEAPNYAHLATILPGGAPTASRASTPASPTRCARR